MTQIESAAVTRPTGRGFRAALRRQGGGLVLLAHRLADRCDAIPSEFGAAATVDETDAHAVAREWLRLLRVWADDNPEGVFALKAGGATLAAALVGLWILVAVMW